MKMRGRRNSGWYAGCGCYIAGKGREQTLRHHEKIEIQKEIEEQLAEEKGSGFTKNDQSS